MTEQNNNEPETTEPKVKEPEINQTKKVSLKDAIRNKLAQNKQKEIDEKNNPTLRAANEKVKSQMTKKVNNQHRRTGGS